MLMLVVAQTLVLARVAGRWARVETSLDPAG